MRGLSVLSPSGWLSTTAAVEPSFANRNIESQTANKQKIILFDESICPKNNFPRIAYAVLSDPEKNFTQLSVLNKNLRGKFRQLAWTTLAAILSKINIEKTLQGEFDKLSKRKKDFNDYQKYIEKTFKDFYAVLKKKVMSSVEKPHIKLQAVQCMCDLLKTKNHLTRCQSSVSFISALAFSQSSFIHSHACFCIQNILNNEYESKEVKLMILRCFCSHLKGDAREVPHISSIIDCLKFIQFNSNYSEIHPEKPSQPKAEKTHLSVFSRKLENKRRKLQANEEKLKHEIVSEKLIKINADMKSTTLSIYNIALKHNSLDMNLLISVLKNLCRHPFITPMPFFVDLSTKVKACVSNSEDHISVISLIDGYIDLYIQLDTARSIDINFAPRELRKRISSIDIHLISPIAKKIVDHRLLTLKDMFFVFGQDKHGKELLKLVFKGKYDSLVSECNDQEIPVLIPI